MRTAILLVDHGSRLQGANALLREVAEMVRAQAPAGTIVCQAHLEIASPSIQEGIDRCVAAGAEEVVVHPYMLAPGRHSTLDIPRLAGEAARRHPGLRVLVTEPLGAHPRLAEVILERVASVRAAAAVVDPLRPRG